MRLHRFIPLQCLLLLLLFPSPAPATQYHVNRVVNGDTFIVEYGSVKLTVRMVGIDAPEMSNRLHQVGQPFALDARQYLSKLILDKTVDVKSYGSDRNGRTLAEVFLLNGRNVNLEMLKAGFAEVFRGRPPTGLNMKPYDESEREAKAAKVGMWSQGDQYVSPWDWRRTHGK